MDTNSFRCCLWIAAILAVSSGVSADEEPSRKVLINNNGKITGFSHQMQRDTRSYLEEILLLCQTTKVEGKLHKSSLNVQYANDSHIYVQYKQPRHFQIGNVGIGIVELLMPVPSDSFPTKIWAKDGTNLYLFSDCSAKTIRERICTNWLHYWFDDQYKAKCGLGAL